MLFVNIIFYLLLFNDKTFIYFLQTEALVGASAEVEKVTQTSNPKNSDDIMSVLLAHEKRGGDGSALTAAAVKAALPDPSDSSDGEQSHDESPTSPDGINILTYY